MSENNGKLQWYTFNQNKSGGRWHINDDVAHWVLVQAYDCDEAIRHIEPYADNSDSCSCCGDRWFFYPDGPTDQPTICGQPILEYKDTLGFTNGYEIRLHRHQGCILKYKLGEKVFLDADGGVYENWDQASPSAIVDLNQKQIKEMVTIGKEEASSDGTSEYIYSASDVNEYWEDLILSMYDLAQCCPDINQEVLFMFKTEWAFEQKLIMSENVRGERLLKAMKDFRQLVLRALLTDTDTPRIEKMIIDHLIRMTSWIDDTVV